MDEPPVPARPAQFQFHPGPCFGRLWQSQNGYSRIVRFPLAGGAAALPAAYQRRDQLPGQRIACIMSGGNIDQAKLKAVLE